MSTPEVRSSIKWSAIRSKAVPSNLMRAVTHPVPNILGAAEAKLDGNDKSGKPAKDRNAYPARLHKAAFAGSTGSSHL